MLKNYNPDVLSCLANLSNDEVFTSPQLANQLLNLLPQELFKNKGTTFLDPCCKSGVFLREIAKRLIKGLEKEIPNLQKRLNHIYTKQLFAISITELTALLSRRSVYCSKKANGKYSICSEFKTEYGNILFKKIEHTWKNEKCIYCGASQNEYDRDTSLETHAYQFIHTLKPEEIFNMKFDVIVGNPPYQLNDGGGTGDSAKPIYQYFIQQAKKLNPRYLVMIIPSRWMKGGKGLDKFRKEMILDTRIKKIYDFENSKECFSGLHIDGGVCYFLWDKTYNGKVDYCFISMDGTKINSVRYLKSNVTDTVIRDYRQISILEKVAKMKEEKFSSIVSARNQYGFYADLFNSPNKYLDVGLSLKAYNNSYKIYGVKGKKGGATRVVGYVKKSSVLKNKKDVLLYKLFFSKAYMTTSTVPPEIIIGEPKSLSTETFLQIGCFKTKEETIKCLKYIKTKFFRALLFYNRHSLNISRESFDLIPIQDFNKEWTDEKLYKKYGLKQEEINYIESMIKPME